MKLHPKRLSTPESDQVIFYHQEKKKKELEEEIKLSHRKNKKTPRASLVAQTESAFNEQSVFNGDLGLIPGLGRSPGEENGYPFQYSCRRI